MSEKEHTVLLTTAYWGPVQYYTKLFHYDRVVMEQFDNYTKQTYRNRCVIAAPDGPLSLTVPIEKYEGNKCVMRDIQISDHGNWRHLHWNALESAYRNSPFFEYYADDFRPFYEQKWKYLMDFNEAIQEKVCELMDFTSQVVRSEDFIQEVDQKVDCRFQILPKADFATDPHFSPVEYYQVFKQRHGFLPNLSVADLLFNMGPESVLILRDSFVCPDEL